MANRTYRYFKGKPLYRFGDGLSYTTFAYSHLKLSTHASPCRRHPHRRSRLSNTGAAAGDEVAELYLTPPQTNVSPNWNSQASSASISNAGETKHIVFNLDPRTLSQVDDKGIRAVTSGEYHLTLGSSQPTGDASSANPGHHLCHNRHKQAPPISSSPLPAHCPPFTVH